MVKPRIGGARDGIFSVIHQIIAENLRSRGFGGRDAGPAVNQAMGLIIIHRFGHVAGNYRVVLPKLGDAIDLRRQQNGDPGALQITRERDRRGCPPTVPEKYDAGRAFFLCGKNAVAVRIERAKDRPVGVPAVTIFKHLHKSTFGGRKANALGQLNRALVHIVVANEATDKADDDRGGCG
jgi:hypothetical protein